MENAKHNKDDAALLQQFFAEHRQTVADDGFAERVMVALTARRASAATAGAVSVAAVQAATLRRWRLALNALAVIGTLALLIHLNFFPLVWEFIYTAAMRLVAGCINLFGNLSVSLNPENMLVQLILFFRHLPEKLPSASQLLGLFLTALVLLPITITAAMRRRGN